MKLTVKQIFEMIDNKELFYDQTTQRQFIYANMYVNTTNGDVTKAGNVIRSILLEKIQLPALFFWKRDDGKYNIHDGKQRILSLYYFCNSRNKENISITTRLESEYTFETLPKTLKDELLYYKFDVVIKEGPKELEERSFDLINTNSVPLTDYECIRGLSYGKWFKGFEEFLTAQGQALDKIPSQIGRGEEALWFLLAYFSYLDDPSWKIKIRDQLNIVRNNEFNANANNYYEKIHLFNDISKSCECQIKICLQIADYIIKNKWNPEPIIKYYRDGLKDDNDFKKWKIDNHIIAITNLVKNNVQCDYKRFFSSKDKSILYKQKQKCNHPDCTIDAFDELVVDHIKAWSDGGTTTLKNAQLLCKKHNSSKRNDSYVEWIKANRSITNEFKKVNLEKRFTIIDAWISFEIEAKTINQFKLEQVQNNSRINVQRIDDVAKKIGLTELEVELLHKIRKERNNLEHPKTYSDRLKDTLLSETDNKKFIKILNQMKEYIDTHKL